MYHTHQKYTTLTSTLLMPVKKVINLWSSNEKNFIRKFEHYLIKKNVKKGEFSGEDSTKSNRHLGTVY